MLLILLFSLPLFLHFEPTNQLDAVFEKQKEFLQIIKKAYKKKYPGGRNSTGLPINIPNPGPNPEPSIPEINKKISKYLYQADILLTKKQANNIAKSIRTKRQINQAPIKLWNPDKPIQFEFSSTAISRADIRKGFKFWEDNSCLNFEEKNTNTNRIRIINGTGCYSNIGKIGGVQDLSLGLACNSLRSVTHEIMHALGFEHQMSRIDRDKYLFINWANIKDDLEYNFYMVDDGQVMSVPYDYGSVMHYGAYHFAENPKIPSMVAYNPLFQYTIGNSQQPSFSDILAVNRLYNCTQKCPKKLNCLNGGFTDPRNCNRCKCPPYFTGQLCGALATSGSCGGDVYQATAASNTLQINVPGGSVTFEPKICNWHIKAPAGKRVELKIIKGGECNCYFTSLEINLGKFNSYGMTVCCYYFDNQVVLSEGNLVALRGFIRFDRLAVTLQYRAI